jgi:hypothetical protein
MAEIGASSPGPGVGAFFDLDGTLVEGFTAAVHVGDRIRRRQAGIGELLGVFEAALRYKFRRLEFERLIIRAAGYLRGEVLNPRSGLAAAAAVHGWPVMCLASGRRRPCGALRYLAKHLRRDEN